ncbi:aldolase [Gymnopus androsaceus JB14]|uniref:hydroxymethylglutaryl-CoA lyase n=1 Tax=Gymnopus androsaceus JB14 TaxID=1447944 RepID=A0A6A4HQT8_9AGAR|nr:aldolase [Gymnopus androsaceus JB14]
MQDEFGLYRPIASHLSLSASTTFCEAKIPVNIVEVGPRDGLQNEKGVIPVDVKVELIERLALAGCNNIEAGSFVSPKWVPQMAGTAEIISRMQRLPDVHYAVLVPNSKGLDGLFSVLNSYNSSPDSNSTPPPSDEISIFTAATDAFTRANLNTTTAESLARLAPVDYKAVRSVAKELLNMGCYEVSLGDTVGRGTPSQIAADAGGTGHFHDTFGTAIANVFTALDHWCCPYSPGATGNVATEDVLYALQGSKYSVVGSEYGRGTIDLHKIMEIGWWISGKLGRESISRAGRALKAKKIRDEKMAKSDGDVRAKL